MENKNAVMLAEEEVFLEENIDFDALEEQIQNELNEDIAEVEFLEEERNKIGNPMELGNVVMNVVVEQFNNQIAMIAGEEFIKNNNGLSLDLRDEAHIQTTENFANGNIATHNTEINYQERYDEWQSNFVKDENGNIVTHNTRSGREEVTLVKGARAPFDAGRPSGSKEKGTDMDHTVSAAEIIRDPEANAHLTKEEQIAFANSDANLNEMDSARNRSKGDTPTEEWLDNPNAKGQKPKEIFGITDEEDKALREKDAQAREEYEKRKKEGEQRSIEAGKKSQREEFKRIGKEVLKSMFFQLLGELLKDVVKKLVGWFKKTKRKMSELYAHIKEAVKNFFSNIKERILGASQSASITILTAIYKPIGEIFTKFWAMIKQGWRSLKEAYNYLKSDEAKNQPFSIKVMQVGKIIVAGLTAIGAIVLGGVITEASKAIPIIGPFLAMEIPIIGSLASMFGLFMGALISGVIGAIVINFMDKFIAKKQQSIITNKIIDKNNEILHRQAQLQVIAQIQNDKIKENVESSISERHRQAHDVMKESLRNTSENCGREYREHNQDVLDVLDDF